MMDNSELVPVGVRRQERRVERSLEAELEVYQQQEPVMEATPLRVIEKLTRNYAEAGKYFSLYTIGEFWEEAAAARSDADAGWYAVVQWLEEARAAYNSALIAYKSQSEFQDPKFAADLEERLFLVTSRIKNKAPSFYQMRELHSIDTPAEAAVPVFAGR